jgi:hypothetical protein
MIKNSSNCQRFKATHIAKQRKPAAPDKACQRVCLSPRSDEKKKHDCTTMAIRNAGFSAKLKVNEH